MSSAGRAERWEDPCMGQVISFPKQRREHVSRDRLLNALCIATYMLGFFIAAPMLGMFALGFAFTGAPVAALACAAGLALVCKLTRVAYVRL
jgi:hypothetical protein